MQSTEATCRPESTAGSTPRYLPRERVAEYTQLTAEQSRIEKRKAELREELLPQILQGYESPPDLPFLLQNRPQQRKERDWCAVVALLIPQHQIDDIESMWPIREVPAIVLVPNPDFVLPE